MPPPRKLCGKRVLTGFTPAEVFVPNPTCQQTNAFTLAEVLITLGIIGVVAALTIPTLIANHKKSVVEKRLAKFYSVINQAIIMSEVDNGEKEGWESFGNSSDKKEWFNKYMAKYLNTVAVDFNDSINTQRNKPIQVYFSDGSMAVMGTSWIFFPEAKKYKNKTFGDDDATIYLDTSVSGKEWFTFLFSPANTSPYHKGKGMEPYLLNWDGNQNSLYNHTSLGCRKNVSGTTERAYCTAVIQQNGWHIPDDYPIKF